MMSKKHAHGLGLPRPYVGGGVGAVLDQGGRCPGYIACSDGADGALGGAVFGKGVAGHGRPWALGKVP
jgi:hypothetical protein